MPFIILGIWAVGIIGWVMNIVKLFGMINDPITGMAILRGVGIFLAPLGAVLGFL